MKGVREKPMEGWENTHFLKIKQSTCGVPASRVKTQHLGGCNLGGKEVGKGFAGSTGGPGDACLVSKVTHARQVYGAWF